MKYTFIELVEASKDIGRLIQGIWCWLSHSARWDKLDDHYYQYQCPLCNCGRRSTHYGW